MKKENIIENINYYDALVRISKSHDTYNSRTSDNHSGARLFVEGDHVVTYCCCLVDYSARQKSGTISTGKSLNFECNITKGTLYNACCVDSDDILYSGTLDDCIEFFKIR